MVLLLPLDQPVFAVQPDHHDKLAAGTDGGFEVLYVHQETGIAADGKNTAVGKGGLRAYRPCP